MKNVDSNKASSSHIRAHVYGTPFQKKLKTFFENIINSFLQHRPFFWHDIFVCATSTSFCWHETLFSATSTCFCWHGIIFCATSNFLFQYKIVFVQQQIFTLALLRMLCHGDIFLLRIIKKRKNEFYFNVKLATWFHFFVYHKLFIFNFYIAY